MEDKLSLSDFLTTPIVSKADKMAAITRAVQREDLTADDAYEITVQTIRSIEWQLNKIFRTIRLSAEQGEFECKCFLYDDIADMWTEIKNELEGVGFKVGPLGNEIPVVYSRFGEHTFQMFDVYWGNEKLSE